jgi:hypothetical protein
VAGAVLSAGADDESTVMTSPGVSDVHALLASGSYSSAAR